VRTLALCVGPAVLLVAFTAAFIHTFRPTSDIEGEQ
jgi:hypothetical protein